MPEAAVRPRRIVLPTPTLDQEFRFQRRAECLHVQKLVTKLPIERLDEQRSQADTLQPASVDVSEAGRVVT